MSLNSVRSGFYLVAPDQSLVSLGRVHCYVYGWWVLSHVQCILSAEECKNQVMGQIYQMASLSNGDGAGHSDRKRTQIPTISQVMQLLADSLDNSGSGLNLSDLDVCGSSSASDVEGVTFQHHIG